jgi:predicted membrane protein
MVNCRRDRAGAVWGAPRLVLGLCIMAVGAVFTLENLGLISSRHVLRYWPVLLIVVGLAKAVHPGKRGWRGAGLLWLTAGTILLLRVLGVIQVSLWKLWPVLLLVIGALVVWRTLRSSPPLEGVDSGATLQITAVLGGMSRSSNSTSFRGGEVTAVLGGCEIDLRQARIQDGEAVIDVSAFMGGIDIRVPEEWSVITNGTPILGGFEDATRPPREDTGQRLVITGFAILGGVEVRN